MNESLFRSVGLPSSSMFQSDASSPKRIGDKQSNYGNEVKRLKCRQNDCHPECDFQSRVPLTLIREIGQTGNSLKSDLILDYSGGTCNYKVPATREVVGLPRQNTDTSENLFRFPYPKMDPYPPEYQPSPVRESGINNGSQFYRTEAFTRLREKLSVYNSADLTDVLKKELLRACDGRKEVAICKVIEANKQLGSLSSICSHPCQAPKLSLHQSIPTWPLPFKPTSSTYFPIYTTNHRSLYHDIGFLDVPLESYDRTIKNTENSQFNFQSYRHY